MSPRARSGRARHAIRKAAVERPPLWRAIASWLVFGGAVIVCAGSLFTQVAPGSVELVLYSGSGLGGAGTDAQTMPQSAAPSALVTGHNVTVSWPATTMSGGTPAPALCRAALHLGWGGRSDSRELQRNRDLDIVRRVDSARWAVALQRARGGRQLVR